MRAIIIGAGRGQRLMPTTADAPKCFAEVQGKRILDWVLEALAANGIDDICFLFQEMIEAGEHLAHVDTAGEYLEIDTQQDFELAQTHWHGAP